MLEDRSLEFIRKTAMRYQATRVLLFGSSLYMKEREAGDIDLAVEGLDIEAHDAMWNDLMWAPELGGMNVDLVRIEDGRPLNVFIDGEGVSIYEGR